MNTDERVATVDPSRAVRDEILASLAGALAEIPEVRLGLAFGSFARGEPCRDIDVGVLLEAPVSWHAPGRVADLVRESMGAMPCALDVVPLNDAPAAFRSEVARHGVVLFEREAGEADAYWVRSISEQMDRVAWLHAHGLGR